MSVINTMLKDLDKRQQSHELENLHVAPVQYQSSTPSKLPWMLLGLVSLVLVSGIVFSWDRLTAKVSDDEAVLSVDSKSTENKAVDIKLAENMATENKAGALDEPGLTSVAAPSIGADNRVAPEGKPDAGVTVKSEQRLTQLPAIPEQKRSSESGVKAAAKPIIKEQQVAAEEALPVITSKKQRTTSTPVSQSVKAEAPVVRSSNNGSMAVTEVKLSDDQLAQKRLMLASEAEQQGGQNDAIVYYNEALTLNPKLHQARKQLAALYYGKGRLDLATDLLRQGISLFPAEFDYVLLLARVQLASGNKAQALSTLSQIPDSSLLARQKWVEQSSLAQEVSDFVLAEQGYRNLLGVEANQARWWMGLAYSLDAQAKYSAAKDAYKQAVLYKSVPGKGLSAQAFDYIENRLTQLGEIE
ncbi:tetratricopeptide TPR_2 repeat protein [Shewanella sediminis HAW-EB3]|uniref:Tetratricopeptide TPR_2 repeat protein n=1 Tax=Shewanella sediminis (strain HAW-EB3) TaxID=425104 RepID=A8FQN5_SHESH|nr:hypothetical protein [Shewanella sediminis]ABV35158.1 tetratricopeptide TPR_2 repeat protein [Shewanella sediminis HAW-EB3]